MSAQHTPGPFHVEAGDPIEMGENAGWFVCHPGAFCGARARALVWAEKKSDADLFAAAPDLLAGCKLAIPSGVSLTNGNIPDHVTVPLDFTMGELRQIAAAIAKAEGRS